MDLIQEINEKYQALEAELDKKLEKVQAEELKLERQNEKLAEKSAATPSQKVLSYEQALQRNANTLKSLEIAKARLRSRTTYSPVEKLLQRALENYKRELESLYKQQSSSKQDFNGQVQADNEEDENAEKDGNQLYDLIMQNVLEASESRRN